MNRQSDAGEKYEGKHKERGTEVVSASTPATDTAIEQKPIVEIHNLKKSYAFKPVLRGIDLTLRQGQRMAILGSNGTGKTTLLRILACLDKPTSGIVKVAGLDLVHSSQRVRQLIGFVAHQPYLYEELTVLENLMFFGRMYNVTQVRERASALLQRVGLERRAQERVSVLSRGQVQRLAWARALLHDPHLLLLDEPETGLDHHGNALIDAIFAEHTLRGGSILFTTHHLERALLMSEQIALLNAGRIAFRRESASLTLDELRQVYREVVK